jgi:NAD(P)-dependent dehydrogenase (short-subunit alcohol dehydrogenase family)
MTAVVISGANRGLGLEFARQYAARGARVYAGARDPARASELNAAATDSDGRLTVHRLDVGSDASVSAFAAVVDTNPVDVLIANAGVFGGDRQHRLGEVSSAEFLDTLNVNTVGPVRLANALIRNLRAGKEKKLIAVTSGMGSIAETGGGYLAYRASKAGLNMIWAALAKDLAEDGIVCVPMSPGWARTDMGGEGAPQAVDETVRQMIARIDEYGPEHSGRFLGFSGREVPW